MDYFFKKNRFNQTPIIVLLAFISLLNHSLCDTCSTPVKTELKNYVTTDATIVSEIGIVSEFSLVCANGKRPSTLYAQVGDNIVPVPRIEGDKFQISWTEEIKQARKGEREVRLFDEIGYAQLKKAIRASEDLSRVDPLTTISIHVPGVFTGPWLKSELIAAIISIVIVYVALSTKFKLLE